MTIIIMIGVIDPIQSGCSSSRWWGRNQSTNEQMLIWDKNLSIFAIAFNISFWTCNLEHSLRYFDIHSASKKKKIYMHIQQFIRKAINNQYCELLPLFDFVIYNGNQALRMYVFEWKSDREKERERVRERQAIFC